MQFFENAVARLWKVQRLLGGRFSKEKAVLSTFHNGQGLVGGGTSLICYSWFVMVMLIIAKNGS